MQENSFSKKSRIIKEYDRLEKINNIQYEIIDKNINMILLQINGPLNTIYYNKKYIIRLDFSSEYPFVAPKVSFLTSIIHPNIYNGSICADSLYGNWVPGYTIEYIILLINHLLTEPDLTNQKKYKSKKHNKYKVESMNYFNRWNRRKNFMLYLVRIGIWKEYNVKSDRFPEKTIKNMYKLRVLSDRSYLENIFSFL